MEELSKKDILTLIGENLTTVRHSGYKGFDEEKDLQEMPPIEPGHKGWPTLDIPDPDQPTKRSKGELPNWTRLFALDDEGNAVKHVGWFGRNPDTQESVPIIFTCEWDELIQQHPNLIPRLKEKYKSINLVEKECLADKPRGSLDKLGIKPIPGSDEVIKVTDTQYQQGFDQEKGEFVRTSTQRKIKEDLHRILSDSLEKDSDLTYKLTKYSLPEIVISNEKHRKTKTVNTNEMIEFRSHNINDYKTLKDFVTSSMTNLSKKPENFERKQGRHMRYQYAGPKYDRRRGASAGSYGETPVFKLPVQDYVENQVIVTCDFKLIGKGQKDNEGKIVSWSWDLEYKVQYGKRSEVESRPEDLIEDMVIRKHSETQLSEPKIFDGKEGDTGRDHPLADINILEALKQVLDEFKTEVVDPKQKSAAIARSMVNMKDLRTRQAALNENEIINLVKKTIIKNK